MIGRCGACGTPLQRLVPGSLWFMYAEPGDSPELAALKAHTAMVHDEMEQLPRLVRP